MQQAIELRVARLYLTKIHRLIMIRSMILETAKSHIRVRGVRESFTDNQLAMLEVR